MEDARSYLMATAPACEGLFRLLNDYGWHKMKAVAGIINSRAVEELNRHKRDFSSNDVAREVIAGSILQIAFVAIERYAVQTGKSHNAIRFECEINRLIRENPKSRWRNKAPFALPDAFCVGRAICDLPLGVVVFAGRNQYNHFGEKRLSVLNEVVFNHLHAMWPAPGNGLSFDLSDGLRPRAYSILAAIGWIDSDRGLGYTTYGNDLSDILGLSSDLR